MTTVARAASALCSAAFLFACKSGPTSASMDASSADARWTGLPEPALYARDGSVVQGTTPDAGMAAEPRHDVSARDGSRMYLLELYQKTVQEKEALAQETQSLHEALVRAGDTQRAIEKERDDSRAEAVRIAKELETAHANNTDLAARLVTAQIRRLEAEKLVLEARIDALRKDAAGNTIETSAPKSAPKEKPKAPAAESAHGGEHP
ncbi:MAG: hypothetical protein HZA53_18345 [Planctomycetes bacterium]|nr:hypothetical protein [Planctomycetota bacterium]